MAPALFFDLDGTLADSERQHWQAWRATLLPFGLDLPWHEFEPNAVGRPDPLVLTQLTSRLSKQPAQDELRNILEEKRRRFIHIVAGAPPIPPNVRDLLRSLRHLDLALVTSSTRVETEAVLHASDLLQYFKSIVCLDDVTHAKPDPEPYQLAKLRMAVGGGIAFEDSKAGKASARAAGLMVVEISEPSDLCAIAWTELLQTVTGSDAG